VRSSVVWRGHAFRGATEGRARASGRRAAEAGEGSGSPGKAVVVAVDTFTIALFAGIDRPAVQQKTVSLDELRQLLSRFEVLADKRRGRCWSPTR
jgi:hypothetical protein